MPSSDDLDEEYGKAAANGDLDPTHLRALAVRIQQLAGLIDLQRSEGRRRDDRIEHVKDELSAARVDIAKIDKDVDDLIKAQFTPSERQKLLNRMNNDAFRERAWKTGFRYLGYAAAVATFFYTFSGPLLKFMAAIGKAMS